LGSGPDSDQMLQFGSTRVGSLAFDRPYIRLPNYKAANLVEANYRRVVRRLQIDENSLVSGLEPVIRAGSMPEAFADVFDPITWFQHPSHLSESKGRGLGITRTLDTAGEEISRLTSAFDIERDRRG